MKQSEKSHVKYHIGWNTTLSLERTYFKIDRSDM